MPLAAQNRDRDYFFVAVTFDQKKYSLVGYAGALDLTDIAVIDVSSLEPLLLGLVKRSL